MAFPLGRLEQITGRADVAARIEVLLPIGVRPRQLLVRTLLLGMLLTQADHRPAHLTRVHQALTSLPEAARIRLGVTAGWKPGPHLLTYRQTERTYGLVVTALGKEHPGDAPSAVLAGILDALLGPCRRYRSRSPGCRAWRARRGEVGPGRPAGVSAGGFPRTASRTRRATLAATGAPQVLSCGT